MYTHAASFLLILSQFHLLRNVSFILLMPYIIGITLVCFFARFERRNLNFVFLILFISVYSIILTFAVNLFYQDYGDPLVGLLRYFYLVPLIVVIFSKNFNREFSLRLLLYFGSLAAITLPYQFLFGEISWFAEVGERAGLIRYSTLLGSLTVFGGIAGPLLILNFYFFDKNFILKYIIAFLLILCGLFSLQKSALASLLMAYLILMAYKFINFKYISLVVFLFGSLIFTVKSEILDQFLIFISNVFGSVDADLKSDDTFFESIIVRIIDRPLESLNYFGIEKFIFGVGYYGAAGGLGYADLPMAHNLLGEMVAMYGVFGMGIFLSVVVFFILYFKKNVFNKSWSFEIACFWVCALSFVSALLTGGLFFQPFASSLFFCSLVVILKKVD